MFLDFSSARSYNNSKFNKLQIYNRVTEDHRLQLGVTETQQHTLA